MDSSTVVSNSTTMSSNTTKIDTAGLDFEIYTIQQKYNQCQSELIDLWNSIEDSYELFTIVSDYSKCYVRRCELEKIISQFNTKLDIYGTNKDGHADRNSALCKLEDINIRMSYLEPRCKGNTDIDTLECAYVEHKLEWNRVYSDYCKLGNELSRLKKLYNNSVLPIYTTSNNQNNEITKINLRLYKNYWSPHIIANITNN
jgi:hypothetical protein